MNITKFISHSKYEFGIICMEFSISSQVVPVKRLIPCRNDDLEHEMKVSLVSFPISLDSFPGGLGMALLLKRWESARAHDDIIIIVAEATAMMSSRALRGRLYITY